MKKRALGIALACIAAGAHAKDWSTLRFVAAGWRQSNGGRVRHRKHMSRRSFASCCRYVWVSNIVNSILTGTPRRVGGR